MTDLDALILQLSAQMTLDVSLIRAMVAIESGGVVWRTRFESGWKYFYYAREFAEKLGITVQTEVVLQSMSFGPMQIMGGVARELGFTDHLTQLILPENSLPLSCKKLKHLLQKYPSMEDAIAAYNAGSVRKTEGGLYENETYVDSVMLVYRKLISLI